MLLLVILEQYRPLENHIHSYVITYNNNYHYHHLHNQQQYANKTFASKQLKQLKLYLHNTE